MTDTPAKPKRWVSWAILLVCMVGTFALSMLLASVMERRHEATVQKPLVEIDTWETDSSKWAVNHPRQYAQYKMMDDDNTRTQFGGSDPRDYLEETPNLVILFSGYGFAKDFLQARGHTYSVEDVNHTKRIAGKHDKAAATCWTCKSPDVPRMMAKLGENKVADPNTATFQELILAGAPEFYSKKFADFKDEITHPIGCLSCHDPETMALRISRPGLIEAFKNQGRDINDVSHQEMRSLVCAQCHVEYYFKGDGKYLTFPWDDGMNVEDMEKYYDNAKFADWTHAISKTRMVKMQHPDYEIYMTGIHAFRGVSCADCHMPYMTEGGAKFSDHHLQSPLLNIANSCAVCHRWSEEEVRTRVEGIQTKVREMRDRSEDALAKAHFDIAACMQAGATDEQLLELRQLVRAAQLRWDYVAANNGMGFHSPQECTRILGVAIDMAGQSRIAAARLLAKLGHTDPVKYPDISTKEKAQALNKAYIAGKGPDLLGRTPVAVK